MPPASRIFPGGIPDSKKNPAGRFPLSFRWRRIKSAAMKPLLAGLALGLFTAFACRGNLQLPEPPQQHKPWHPDAAIPTNILSAAETLFEQGFPDPRGCEYREIEVAVSGVWDGRVSSIKTRGWVLPKKSGTNQFAICWNGLIYPVAKISAPADLHAEITSVVPVPEWIRNPIGEERTVIFTNSSSTRVLLLLRCSETAAALKHWVPNRRLIRESQVEMRKPPTEIRGVENDDPYLQFAGDWAWAMFDRTICAHIRGDEALALATARQLTEVQPKIEAECARRDFQRQPYWDSSRPGQQKPYLDFLEQLPQLLADLERRAKEGNRVSVVESGLQNITNQNERIAALIRDLDLVQARQWGQPGSVNLPEDPIVSALIQEGDAAVEPLINCLETDKRLTRSVGFWRDFFRDRTVVPVSKAALAALQTILQASFQGGASEIRAYWNRYKSMNLDERCYAILNDDSAASRWLEAAAHITQPENVTTFPGGCSMTKPVSTNAPVRLRGEILRAKSNPSVTGLMARRATEVPANKPNAYDLSAACQMGLYLAAWDTTAAAPVAKTLLKRCRTVMEYSDPQNSRPDERLGTFVAKLALACAQTGDAQAFEDYAAWLKTTTPEQLGFFLSESLEPLRKFPTNEILQAAADSLFSDTNSVWSKLPWRGAGLSSAIEPEFISVPAFRRLLSRELDKKTVCGFIEWQMTNMASFQITNYLSGSRELALPEGNRPAIGTKTELRWCDWIAWSLANAKQIPLFNPFAPIEKRDEAIQKAKGLLDPR
jgi:hypothetical protein